MRFLRLHSTLANSMPSRFGGARCLRRWGRGRNAALERGFEVGRAAVLFKKIGERLVGEFLEQFSTSRAIAGRSQETVPPELAHDLHVVIGEAEGGRLRRTRNRGRRVGAMSVCKQL
jgi:hypothetical protein